MIAGVHVQYKVAHDREKERESVCGEESKRLEGMSWRYRDMKSCLHMLYSYHHSRVSMMVYVCEGEEKERLHVCEKEGIHHVRHLPLRLLLRR